jgi:DNA-binding PadR family transcriptional regulator
LCSSRGASSRGDLHECPCSGTTLSKFVQPAIMTILARGGLHGYRIVEAVANSPMFAGCRPGPTGVYRVLRTMEERGLVVSTWGVSDKGPARRSYQLTGQGRECFRRWIGTLDEHRRAIGRLLGAARKAAAKMENHVASRGPAVGRGGSRLWAR